MLRISRFIAISILPVVLLTPCKAQDAAQWAESVKPIDKLFDEFRFDDAITGTFALAARHAEQVKTKRENIERVSALLARAAEAIASGKAKVAMKDVSRRYGYMGAVARIDANGVTSTVGSKKMLTKWQRLSKEEIRHLLELCSDPDSADDQLALAAFCMEGVEKLPDSAMVHLGRAAKAGRDIAPLVAYLDTVRAAAAKPADTAAPEEKTKPTHDDAPVAVAATGEKIPHPLSKKTDTARHNRGKVAVPEGMVLVPTGEFILGDNSIQASSPAHSVRVAAFFVDKYEVTNAQYRAFVKATGHRAPRHWEATGDIPEGRENHPVTYVSWDDAKAYCDWCGKRLPTEAEWEKAAVWDMKFGQKTKYPWGNQEEPGEPVVNWITRYGYDKRVTPSVVHWRKEFEKTEKCRKLIEAGGGTTPVGSFPEGASPSGCLDMAGNVYEWVADWFDRYPGNKELSQARARTCGQKHRVLRGSSWYCQRVAWPCTYRITSVPGDRSFQIGFRCAADGPADTAAAAKGGKAKRRDDAASREPDDGKQADGDITTAANGEKIPHPLSKRTYKGRHKRKRIDVPEGMVFVPGGAMVKGDDSMMPASPAHEAQVAPFFIDKYDVTNAQYRAFTDATGHRVPLSFRGHGGNIPPDRENRPVTFVSWEDVKAYCDWCGKRLPTEAEWEMAASWDPRKKCKYRFSWGDTAPSAVGPTANYWARWGGDSKATRWQDWWTTFAKTEKGKELIRLGGGTTPVGASKKNKSPYGCYDMSGNVWNWTADWFERYPGNMESRAGVDPYFGKTRRTMHGGSWRSPANALHVAYRHFMRPEGMDCNIGFRCAADYPYKAK